MRTGVVCLIAASITLSGCATSDSQNANTGRTMAEGAGVGAVLGAGLGYLLGGKEGALLGAALGGAGGLAAGGYVAQQKNKYATIEDRIAGERDVAAQATATARSQTAASEAQLRLADAQLAELRAMTGSKEEAQRAASDLLANLKGQRGKLEVEKQELQTAMTNQIDFIAETEQEIGSNDTEKLAQLAQWKAEIPNMQAAVVAMTDQIASFNAMETNVLAVASPCC